MSWRPVEPAVVDARVKPNPRVRGRCGDDLDSIDGLPRDRLQWIPVDRRGYLLALCGDLAELVYKIGHRSSAAVLGYKTFDVFDDGLSSASGELLDLAELPD